MEKYIIEENFPSLKGDEISIISDRLIYSELCNGSCCQSTNLDNNDLIHKKCRQISELIKEIDLLNK